MAKKRRYPLYFYTTHDMDLIALDGDNFNIIQAVYLSLKGFCNKQSFLIKAPPGKGEMQFKKRRLSFNLYLDPEEDAEAISLLEHIRPGARNNFLKNLTRLYLLRPAAEGFLEEDAGEGIDERYFEDRLVVLQEGRRIVEMRFIPRRKRRKKTEIVSKKPPKKKSSRYAASWDDIHGNDGNGEKSTIPYKEEIEATNKKTEIPKEKENKAALFEERYPENNKKEEKDVGQFHEAGPISHPVDAEKIDEKTKDPVSENEAKQEENNEIVIPEDASKAEVEYDTGNTEDIGVMIEPDENGSVEAESNDNDELTDAFLNFLM